MSEFALSADDLEGPPAAPAPAAKARKKRATSATKRATSAFQYFSSEQRPIFKAKAGKDDKAADISLKLAAAWKGLSESERAPYLEKAREDKLRPKATKSGKRLRKDPRKPKKPKTSYLFFADEVRPKMLAQQPGADVTRIAPGLAVAWKELSDEDRKKYTDLAEKDKKRYEEEMAKYMPSQEYLAASELFKQQLKKGSATKKGGKAKGGTAQKGDSAEQLLTLPVALATGSQMPVVMATSSFMQIQLPVAMASNVTAQNKASSGAVSAGTQAIVIDQPVATASARAAPTLQAENKRLQAALKEKEKALKQLENAYKKQESQLAKLQKKDSAVREPKRKESETQRYLRWTREVMGEKGEKATSKMKKLLNDRGEDALAELLATMYKEQHPENAARKRAADASGAPASKKGCTAQTA